MLRLITDHVVWVGQSHCWIYHIQLFEQNSTQTLRASHLGKKNPEISVGAKVEFPIGKKLFHLVVNPGTWRCPTVNLELVQTTRNGNGTRL